eukprot:m.245192 g.245192  ORF g.245192 m.245192 type:complete len:139 (+) comp40254_c3_seq27:242-658(+)
MNVPVLERFAADVYSDDAERHRIGCRGIRSLLTKDGPPVDDVIAMGIVPRLVEFVHSHDDGQVQFEAAWALTNVASGSSKQTRVVVESGAVPVFVEALGTASDDVKEQVDTILLTFLFLNRLHHYEGRFWKHACLICL